MRRRRFLGVVASTPFVAGCSGILQSGNGVLDDRGPPPRGQLRTQARPPAERPVDATEDTVESLQYPTKPPTYDDQSVQTFVEAHERAYRRNELLDQYGGSFLSHSFDFAWTATIDTSGQAGVGRCQYTFTTRLEDGDDVVVGDSATNVVTYYVDDAMVVRARGTGEADQRRVLAPDPWKTGVVLESDQ